jgi:uncharacterized OB-fold protein
MSDRFFPDDMPTPAASVDTLPWWQAAAQHRLVVQECASCGATRHPPRPICARCHDGASTWRELPGTGAVYTFTRVHQAFIPSLAERLPYVVAAIDLDDSGGARLISNLVDVDPELVRVGTPVEVVWDDRGPELALPRFRPRGAQAE